MVWGFSPDDAGRGLSIIASILSITSSVKKIASDNKVDIKQAIEIFRKTASKEERDVLSENDTPSAIVELSVIDPDVLRQLATELEECKAKHFIAGRQSAGDSEYKKREANSKYKLCVCNLLNTIKEFNNGELPFSGPFRELWISCACL